MAKEINEQKEQSLLERFNSGEMVAVEIVSREGEDRLGIFLKRNGNDVRAAISYAGENAERGQKVVTELGGYNGVVRMALNSIGVNQEIEKDSGVLRNLLPDKKTIKKSFDNF